MMIKIIAPDFEIPHLKDALINGMQATDFFACVPGCRREDEYKCNCEKCYENYVINQIEWINASESFAWYHDKETKELKQRGEVPYVWNK